MTDPISISPVGGIALQPRPAPTSAEAVDRELVQRAQTGNRDAFSDMFKLTVRSVTRYVGAIIRDETRTEDVVAQTYLDAWRQLPRLREPERFSAWLLRIAHNRAIDELRLPFVEPIEDTSDLSGPQDEEPEVAVLRQADVDKVRGALLGLPADHREVVSLRFLQGLSHSEVALQMGRSEDASRALLHRALRRMRRSLEAN